VFPHQAPLPLGNQFLDVVLLCVQLLLGLFTYRWAMTQENKKNMLKNGPGYTIMKKLFEIGGCLNKGYHVLPVPLPTISIS
jgi:hypothetical protein